jgi:Protein of unknown function (DUF3108)
MWLAVLVVHMVSLTALDTSLTLTRLAPHPPLSMEVAIIQAALPQTKTFQPPTPPRHPRAQVGETQPATLLDAVAATLPVTATESVPTPQPATSVTTSIAANTGANQGEGTHAAALHPAVVPTSTVLRYTVTKGHDTVQARLTWQVQPHHAYELAMEATYFGFTALRQTSRGHWDEAGLRPDRYSDKRRGKPEQAVHFGYDTKTMVFSNNRPDAPLPLGAQDRASMLVHLASLLAAQPERYRQGSSISLPIASTDELETWVFEVALQESISLPIGSRETLKLIRRPRRAFDQTVELWLSPTEHYLPVRIRLTDSSGITDQQLTSVGG